MNGGKELMQQPRSLLDWSSERVKRLDASMRMGPSCHRSNRPAREAVESRRLICQSDRELVPHLAARYGSRHMNMFNQDQEDQGTLSSGHAGFVDRWDKA